MPFGGILVFNTLDSLYYQWVDTTGTNAVLINKDGLVSLVALASIVVKEMSYRAKAQNGALYP